MIKIRIDDDDLRGLTGGIIAGLPKEDRDRIFELTDGGMDINDAAQQVMREVFGDADSVRSS